MIDTHVSNTCHVLVYSLTLLVVSPKAMFRISGIFVLYLKRFL